MTKDGRSRGWHLVSWAKPSRRVAVLRVDGRSDYVLCASKIDTNFSPDGQVLFSLDRNNTLRGWALDWQESYTSLIRRLAQARRDGRLGEGALYQIRIEYNVQGPRKVDWIRYKSRPTDPQWIALGQHVPTSPSPAAVAAPFQSESSDTNFSKGQPSHFRASSDAEPSSAAVDPVKAPQPPEASAASVIADINAAVDNKGDPSNRYPYAWHAVRRSDVAVCGDRTGMAESKCLLVHADRSDL